MPLDLTQTLADLVALPSVNPMGRPIEGPEFFEHRMTDYLERLFQKLGLPYERRTVEPQRDNIIARLDGDRPADDGGGVVMFEAHQDTVPVDGMTIDPWSPVVREGRLYGRGACDIKGGMTAMLGALARLAEERPPGRPTIIMACTVNEEHGYTGATALTSHWTERGSIFPRRPDVAVVAEPTQLQVVVAHKGVVRWRLLTHGRATHSSQPQLGVNAIFKMRGVLAALETYQREVAPTLGEHPLCGHPTLSVGTISGGLSVNTVPDCCAIEIDRRLIPGENPHAAQKHVAAYVAEATKCDAAIENEPPFMLGFGLSDRDNASLAARMVAAARAAGIDSKAVGVPYGTDAAVFAGAGVPSIVFGPGSIDEAHTADEWVSLDELSRASEALYRFGCGGV